MRNPTCTPQQAQVRAHCIDGIFRACWPVQGHVSLSCDAAVQYSPASLEYQRCGRACSTWAWQSSPTGAAQSEISPNQCSQRPGICMRFLRHNSVR